jgi:hypothetical protein
MHAGEDRISRYRDHGGEVAIREMMLDFHG